MAQSAPRSPECCQTPATHHGRAYIDTVERKEGTDAAQKLKVAFTEWWGMK